MRPFLVAMAFFLSLGSFPADKPAYDIHRKHKCPSGQQDSKRQVIGLGLVEMPKLLHHPMADLSRYKPEEIKYNGRVLFEILVNEKGAVECVEVLKDSGNSIAVVTAMTAALMQFKYTIPRNKQGNPISVYLVIAIGLHPERP